MSVTKRLICLANSRKLSGRCIAGIELSVEGRRGWIRPVSARPHEEVSEHERQFQDGSDPRVLDVMVVSLMEPKPKGYQQENWLLDPSSHWKWVARASWALLAALEDPKSSLWLNGYRTFNGQNDRIPLHQALRLTSSLRLVHVDWVFLLVYKPGLASGNTKRRVQAGFIYGKAEYLLWVTDPGYERAYLQKPDGAYLIGESFLTISLGEPFEGSCYKLVAAIIEKEAA